MLLVIDVGNTNTVIGLYEEDRLRHHWRLGTDAGKTVDEYGMLMFVLFQMRGLKLDIVKDVVISCVVPPMLNLLEPLCENCFQKAPLIIGPGIKTGMPIYYDNPREVGADRIVNAVAGYEKYRRSLIIVDFGTATTFDYVNDRGDYHGGSIAPGIAISTEALFKRASKLPRIEFSKPKSVIGKDTISSMQAGIMFGYAGLVDGIVTRMICEARTEPYVVATGGLAKVIAPETRTINEVDEMLTLEGLRIIYSRNR